MESQYLDQLRQREQMSMQVWFHFHVEDIFHLPGDYNIIIIKQPIVSIFKSQESMVHLSDMPQMDLESMVLEIIGECPY